MTTANRDLAIVGIKLIGLWILFNAVLAFGKNAMTGLSMRHASTAIDRQAPWKAPEGIAANTAQEMTEKSATVLRPRLPFN